VERVKTAARKEREPDLARSASPRTLGEEVAIVLSLSLLASAAYAMLDLLSAPVNRSVAVVTFSQSPQLARQLLDIAFALPPVWLVFYLVRRNGEGAATIGMSLERPLPDLVWGVALAAIVGAAGIGVYLGAVQLGINRIVVPVPPTGRWWTVPVFVLGAAQNALLEETVVVGYLVTRLRQIGWGAVAAVAASAVLRGSYHLYQGWGGFAGNLAMGLFFGWIFLRWRRTWPLVVAHTLIDVGAAVLYIMFKSHLPGVTAG
jgi:membrane protease YdiL (CAAX protease family)